jgi:hypothetical protein
MLTAPAIGAPPRNCAAPNQPTHSITDLTLDLPAVERHSPRPANRTRSSPWAHRRTQQYPDKRPSLAWTKGLRPLSNFVRIGLLNVGRVVSRRFSLVLGGIDGLGGVNRGGRRRSKLSQIERTMRQTLSAWKEDEDDEEVDALILDSPKAQSRDKGDAFILRRRCGSHQSSSNPHIPTFEALT